MGLKSTLRSEQRGATLVEFAIVLPLLLVLLMGIIEFGWVFAQNLDVRHGAREGARLAAVDELTGVGDVCSRMDTAAHPGLTQVTVTRPPGGTSSIGDDIVVSIEAPVETLTGFLDWAIPSSMTLESTVTIRAEKASSAVFNGACP